MRRRKWLQKQRPTQSSNNAVRSLSGQNCRRRRRRSPTACPLFSSTRRLGRSQHLRPVQAAPASYLARSWTTARRANAARAERRNSRGRWCVAVVGECARDGKRNSVRSTKERSSSRQLGKGWDWSEAVDSAFAQKWRRWGMCRKLYFSDYAQKE